MYKITLNDRQLACMKMALEDYFRTRMGQYFDLATDMAYVDYKEGNNCVERRNNLQSMFESAYRNIMNPGHRYNTVSQEARIVEDMWQVIRHKIWLDNPNRAEWSVDSREALPVAFEPLIKVERIEE